MLRILALLALTLGPMASIAAAPATKAPADKSVSPPLEMAKAMKRSTRLARAWCEGMLGMSALGVKEKA